MAKQVQGKKKKTKVKSTKTKHCPLACAQRKIRNIAKSTGCTLADAQEIRLAQMSAT